MPRNQIASAFGKRWREYLKRVSKRVDAAIEDVGEQVAMMLKEELEEKQAPWTGGGLLGRDKHSAKARTGHYPVTPTGFFIDYRKTGSVRTVVLKNELWPVYGRDLEEGNVKHNPDLEGRKWDPGFVLSSLQVVKARFKAENR